MPLDKLSGGQLQKVQLGVTVVNDPRLLILDEPPKGVDPLNRRLLMGSIEGQQRAGAAVIMVTHRMEEVERLCDRVILLKDATSHACGTVTEVQEQVGDTVCRVSRTGPIPASERCTVLADSSTEADLAPAPGTDQATALRELVAAGVPVPRFATQRTSLEDVFIRVYGAAGRNGEG